MRTINKMVIQPNTPNDNKVLWLNKNNASYYNNGTWVTIGKSSEDVKKLEEKVDSLDGDMQTAEKEIQDINSRHNSLNTKHESLSRTVQGIAATGGASTATNVTYNNDASGLNAENAQDAIDELQSSKIDKTSILQESGEAEDKVMSQKAVSIKLSDLSYMTQGLSIPTINDFIIDKTKITLSVGEQMEQGGAYIFGQPLDSVPAYKNNNVPIYKAVKTLGANYGPIIVLLDSCSSFTKEYRSYAIFDTEGNIIKEDIANGDVVLIIRTSCTILASCKGIYYTSYGNYVKNTVSKELAKKFDKENIVQELGNATNKVVSQNVVSAINTKVNKLLLNSAGFSIPTFQDFILDESKITTDIGTQKEQGGLYWYGQKKDAVPGWKYDDVPIFSANIMQGNNARPLLILLRGCKSAAKGYRSYAIYDTEGTIIKEDVANGNIYFIIKESCTILASCDGIYKVDYGNYVKNTVSGELNGLKEQIKALDSIKESLKSPFEGKTLWTLCDSLGENTWQPYFVKKSGITFYDDLNINPEKVISQGGTSTHPKGRVGGQSRAINLVSYKDTYPMDYVIIENINDSPYARSNKGTIEDAAYMKSVSYSYSPQSFTSYEEAKQYFEEHFSEFITTFEKKIGAMFYIPYTSGSKICGSRIEFTNKATTEGDISIVINGKKSIHVIPEMTIQDIIDKFMIWSYGSGWSIVDNGDNSVSVTYYTETSLRPTFEGNNTGVTANVTDTTGSSAYVRYFVSKNINDWNNVSNWKEDVSLYSIYKGLVEYLKSELPTTLFYWLIPFAYNFDFDSQSLKNEDGSYSQDKFAKSSEYTNLEALYAVQENICGFYGIPMIDLRKNSNMSLFNAEYFFNKNNVHPKQVGYERYADTIYKLMK